jgi:hypothetical protein
MMPNEPPGLNEKDLAGRVSYLIIPPPHLHLLYPLSNSFFRHLPPPPFSSQLPFFLLETLPVQGQVQGSRIPFP